LLKVFTVKESTNLNPRKFSEAQVTSMKLYLPFKLAILDVLSDLQALKE
jgi:hypothetical protein